MQLHMSPPAAPAHRCFLCPYLGSLHAAGHGGAPRWLARGDSGFRDIQGSLGGQESQAERVKASFWSPPQKEWGSLQGQEPQMRTGHICKDRKWGPAMH